MPGRKKRKRNDAIRPDATRETMHAISLIHSLAAFSRAGRDCGGAHLLSYLARLAHGVAGTFLCGTSFDAPTPDHTSSGSKRFSLLSLPQGLLTSAHQLYPFPGMELTNDKAKSFL